MSTSMKRRPWNIGQGDIRAHPPVESARDQCTRGVWVDRSDVRPDGPRGDGPRRWGSAWREDRAIAEQRIEDPDQAAGEGGDRDVLSTAGRDVEGADPERSRQAEQLERLLNGVVVR